MKVLLVKTSSLGDIIQTLPVVSFLKGKYPETEIDWVVENSFREILEAHPDIHTVIPIEMRTWRKNLIKHRSAICLAIKTLRYKNYDLLFDLQGNIKSALITKCIRAKEKVGTTFKSAPEWPNALFLNHRYPLNGKDPISLQYLSIPQQHFSLKPHPIKVSLTLSITQKESTWLRSKLKGKYRMMICPGSHWENKKLSLPTWIELLKELSQRKETYFYIAWGSPKEEQEALALHTQFPSFSSVLPRMRLPLWQNFMSHMDAIYTVDSSALHLAATTGVPTFSFFGPSNATVYKPPQNIHQAFQGTCPYGKTFIKRCPALRTCKTGACLKGPNSAESLINSITPN